MTLLKGLLKDDFRTPLGVIYLQILFSNDGLEPVEIAKEPVRVGPQTKATKGLRVQIYLTRSLLILENEVPTKKTTFLFFNMAIPF
uniref:Uncharacterized protein n=1 Tax=Steinernema glaseri TaxID=37863 RepID=A0A1I8A6J5_9BILA